MSPTHAARAVPARMPNTSRVRADDTGQTDGHADEPDDGAEAIYAALIMRHSSDGIIITDPQRRAIWLNDAFTAMSGYSLEDLRGTEPGTLLQGRDTDPEAARAISQAASHRRDVRVEILNYARDGRPYWVDLRLTPVCDASGQLTHFISVMRDITERKDLERRNEEMSQAEEMRQSERQLLAQTSEWLYSAKSLDELLMVVNRAMHTLIPEADGALYIYANSRNTLDLATSWGTAPDFATHIAPDDCWALRRGRAYAFGQKPIEFPCDHVHDSATPYFCLPIIAHGETIGLLHVSFAGFEEGGMLRHLRAEVLRNRWDLSLICAEQISLAIANVRLRQELHDQSVRDPLTGLWNRRWFLDAAHRELSRALATGAAMALISIDVDHFKRFNDHHGHDAGDCVLRAVGELMKTHYSDRFCPCRIGGEEFVVLCVDTDAPAAAARAEAFRAAIADVRVRYDGVMLPAITVSAGVASFPDGGSSVLDLLKVADHALYQAKDRGRNRVERADRLAEKAAGAEGPP